MIPISSSLVSGYSKDFFGGSYDRNQQQGCKDNETEREINKKNRPVKSKA